MFCGQDSSDDTLQNESEQIILDTCTDEDSLANDIDLNIIDDYQEQIPTLLNNTDFDHLIESGQVLEPKHTALYFCIGIESKAGAVLSAIWDSGAKSSVFLTKYLQDQGHFPNRLTSSAQMETLGNLVRKTDLHQVLLKAQKGLPYSHIQCNAFSVNKSNSRI